VWLLTDGSSPAARQVGGFSLSGADYFHHLLFIPVCGVPGRACAHSHIAHKLR